MTVSSVSNNVTVDRNLILHVSTLVYLYCSLLHIFRKAICPALLIMAFISPPLIAAEFLVKNESELYKAVANANKNRQADTILITDGHYSIRKRLVFKEPNTILKSRSGIAERVVLSGVGMRASKNVEVLIDVHADHITITGITLQNAGNHLIQVRAEKDADHFQLSNCILRDSFEQLLKVSGGKNPKHPYSNNGLVTHSLFEYTAGVGPQYYIGGIDAHRTHGWKISNNTFRNIASPTRRVAEHAIHIWNDSANNTVENNIIINSDRGIGFGMGDLPNQNEGGRITGNTIIHSHTDHKASDTGIVLESSPGTYVSDNVVLLQHKYPNAIEYRFSRTKNVVISNNVVNRRIKSRNGGQAQLTDNHEI